MLTLGILKLPELMLMVVAMEYWDLRRVLLFMVDMAVELLSNSEKFPPSPCTTKTMRK